MSCFIFTTSPNAKSGSRYFLELGKALADRSHRVIAIFSEVRSADFHCDSRIELLHWPSKRPTKWRDFVFIRRVLKDARPDCVIGNFGAVNMLTIAAWLTGVPARIVWYRTLASQLEADHPQPAWLRSLKNLRKRGVYSLATQIIANSDAARMDVHRVFHVPLAKCRTVQFLLADPMIEGIPRDPNKIVSVGRLHASKGHETLVRAMAKVHERYPDAYVEFIGDGEERPRLTALAEKLGISHQCRFLGSKSPQGVLEAMASARVSVVPSRNEAFGWVNVESLSVGTPVIGTETDGIRDLIQDGVTGFLFPVGNDAVLASRLEAILGSDATSAKMSAAAREQFEARFSLTNISKHAQMLEELAVRRSLN